MEAFLKELKKETGLKDEDILKHYVSGGCKFVYPVIGEDGKPHLASKTFKTAKQPKKNK